MIEYFFFFFCNFFLLFTNDIGFLPNYTVGIGFFCFFLFWFLLICCLFFFYWCFCFVSLVLFKLCSTIFFFFKGRVLKIKKTEHDSLMLRHQKYVQYHLEAEIIKYIDKVTKIRNEYLLKNQRKSLFLFEKYNQVLLQKLLDELFKINEKIHFLENKTLEVKYFSKYIIFCSYVLFEFFDWLLEYSIYLYRSLNFRNTEPFLQRSIPEGAVISLRFTFLKITLLSFICSDLKELLKSSIWLVRCLVFVLFQVFSLIYSVFFLLKWVVKGCFWFLKKIIWLCVYIVIEFFHFFYALFNIIMLIFSLLRRFFLFIKSKLIKKKNKKKTQESQKNDKNNSH